MSTAPQWRPDQAPKQVAHFVTAVLHKLPGPRKKLVFFGALGLAGLLLSTSLLSGVTAYVPPHALGLRQVYYGNDAGIGKDVFQPGLYFMLPGVERLHLFPNTVQVTNFSDSSSEESAAARSAPSIKIQTSDGYNVQLDVTVLFRLSDPYKVLTEAGPGHAFQDRLVIPRSDQILRKTLGELNSEEFYQGPKRIAKSTRAHELLKAELAPFGIDVVDVLVRRYVYDERYQHLIEGRKIKDQTVFLRQAEAKAAVEERLRDTIVAEGKANQEVELARGNAEIQKLKAQAELYRRKRDAEGNLQIQIAEAKGTELENSALQGAGSENMVGLKMAEVLSGVKMLVLPTDGKNGMNPLNLAEMLRTFEVK